MEDPWLDVRSPPPLPAGSCGSGTALLIAALPLALAGQTPAQRSAATATRADDIIKQEGYAVPPKELADAVLAPRHLNVALSGLSPDKKWFVDEVGDGPVAMKTFSKPFHELGGVFVDYKANRARALTIRNSAGVQLIAVTDGTKKPVQLPAGARVSNATWSPDSSGVAFFVHGEDATHIWFAEVASGKARQLTKTPVLATMVTTFVFSEDGKTIASVQVPENRAAMPAAPTAPTGPTVKLADADRNRLRTFPSLMSSVHDKELLEWHATGQVALLDVQKGAVRKVGVPAMVRSLDVSTDAKYLRVSRMVKPFSYDVPVASFASVDEVWDTDGKPLAKVSDRAINLGVQDDSQPPDPNAGAGGGRGGQQQGKREIAWRPDGQGLTYVEQEAAPAGERNGAAARGAAPATADDQEPPARGGRGTQPQRKDRVYQWTAPFDEASRKVVYENATRITGHRFSPDMQVLFFSERAGQNAVETAVYLNDPSKKYTLARYRADDVYANPGTIVSTRGTAGGGGRGGAGAAAGGRGGGGATGPVQLSADSQSVFFQGTAYDRNPSQAGPKTFIDRVAIKTGEKTRIYESDNDNVYERVTTVLDADARRFVVAREGPTEVAQNFLVDGTRRIQLTRNQDFTPDITKARIERFTVERPDGFKFRVTVNLPQDYQAGTRLPAIFWFYPREYQDQDSYRSARPDVQQERLPLVRHPFDGVLRPSRLRRRRARLPHRRTRRADERQLRARSAHQHVGGDRRARSPRPRRPHAAGDRRAQLRRVLGGQRDGAHAVLQGGHRRRRRLQPHADADRLPERAPRPLGGTAGLPEHVAVPVCQPPHRRAADVSRPGRSERRHRSDQLAAAVPRPERARENDGAVSLPARGPRPGVKGDPARPLGALGGVARQIREEPEARPKERSGRSRRRRRIADIRGPRLAVRGFAAGV